MQNDPRRPEAGLPRSRLHQPMSWTRCSENTRVLLSYTHDPVVAAALLTSMVWVGWGWIVDRREGRVASAQLEGARRARDGPV